jgi:hypothetical protein
MSLCSRVVQRCIVRPLMLVGLLVAFALVMDEPLARATTSAVTVGGPFTLSTLDGTTVTDQTYRGKWLLVYFGYTFCPSSCPTTLLAVSMALKKLGPDAAQVRPLFITVDPERDTPKVMQQYIESASLALRNKSLQPPTNTAPTTCGTRSGPVQTTMSWTTVRTFTSWIREADSSAPSIPMHQATRSRTCCTHSWRAGMMKELTGINRPAIRRVRGPVGAIDA